MWWSLLLTLAYQLLKWLLSQQGPLAPKDEAKLREFLKTTRQIEARAHTCGVSLP